MVSNMYMLQITRPRHAVVFCGHAMPICLAPITAVSGGLRSGPLAIGFQGISVPISRGGPPILTE